MKLGYFNDFRVGVVKGDAIVDVTSVVQDIPHTGPGDLMNALIGRFDAYRPKIEAAVASGSGVPLASVRIRPPLPKPVNIDCMAVNYMEDGTRSEPALINAFHKSPGAIIGNGDTMVLPDAPATIFEGEAELALVIGKRASHVSQANALDCIFGYTNFIDGSARGLPAGGFFHMKSRDTFAPIGPFIVTKDEIPDPHVLDISLEIGGEILQNSNTRELIFRIPELIEFISSVVTLEPGDIISTGTPSGVGFARKPPRYLKDGDECIVRIQGLGELRNPVVAEK